MLVMMNWIDGSVGGRWSNRAATICGLDMNLTIKLIYGKLLHPFLSTLSVDLIFQHCSIWPIQIPIMRWLANEPLDPANRHTAEPLPARSRRNSRSSPGGRGVPLEAWFVMNSFQKDWRASLY